jgi:tol-pal system protein YbgF
VAALLGPTLGLAGCVTSAEFRALEKQVYDMQRAQSGSQAQERVADISSEIADLRSEVAALQGRLDVIEKNANDALGEVRTTRREVAALSAASPGAGAEKDPQAASRGATADAALEAAGSPEEVTAYREAYAAWRDGQNQVCIDRFRAFLQTYPKSAYADDGAFWMADCHYKQGDYKNAVLRFDDVVRNYPTGNKAPEALYRQGEALLKLGPNFNKAARRAFERVVKEYPDSATAAEARKQLEVLGG